MKPNRLDRNGECLRRGTTAEKLFKKAVEKRPEVAYTYLSTTKQNTEQHIDIWIVSTLKPEHIPMAVKDMKSIRRRPQILQDERFFVELGNDDHPKNQLGWLFGTKAEYIAARRIGYYIIIPVSPLQDFIRSKLGNNWKDKPFTYHNNAKNYVVYQRKGKKDYIMLVPYEDIVENIMCGHVLIEGD